MGVAHRQLGGVLDDHEALGRIDGMTQKLTLVPGPCVVPTVRIKGVQFTGTTEF